MPDTSPGKKRKRRSSQPEANPRLKTPPYLSNDSSASAKFEDIEDSDEGRTVTAKRIKPLKQHSSEVLDNGSLVHQINSSQMSNGEDTGSNHLPTEAKPQKRKWPAAQRYESTPSSHIPQYSAPENTVKSDLSIKKNSVRGGGVRPVNRLQSKPADKVFNLSNSSQPSYNPDNKRQRLNRASSSASSGYVVEIQGDLKHDRRSEYSQTMPRPSQSLGSVQQRSNTTELGNGVPEYKQLGDTLGMKSSRKSRENQHGTHRQPTTFKHGEMDDDPIVDDDGNGRGRARVGSSSIPATKRQTPLWDQFQNMPPPPNDRQTKEALIKFKQLPTESHYFQSNGGGTRSESNGSEVIHDTRRADAQFPIQPKANTGKRVTHQRIAESLGADGDSADELGMDHNSSTDTAYNTAHGLLVRKQQKVLEKNTPTLRVDQNAIDEDIYQICSSSDDEATRTKGNIQGTIPRKATRATDGKGTQDEEFVVVRCFSEQHNWLTDLDKSPWSLLHKDHSLILVNDAHQQTWSIPTTKLERIVHCRDSAKLVLHKSRDLSKAPETKIYLQFSTDEAADALRSSLKTLHSTISMCHNSSEYLEKAFENVRHKSVVHKAKNPANKADDLRLMENNRKTRLLQAALDVDGEEKKASILRSGSSRDARVPVQGVAKALRPRPSSVVLNDHRQSPQLEINSGAFYGNGITIDDSGPSTRASTRAPKREAEIQPSASHRTPSPERWSVVNSNWVDSWKKSIVYPKVGKNKTTVDKEDIPRLDEGEFLNDNIIAFYLLYLENKLKDENKELAKRVYFQNTFFYEKLSGSRKGINYEAVKRWTAKIDLLSFDYIIVPVCESQHWYLAIICNVPKFLAGSVSGSDFQRQGENGTDTDPSSSSNANNSAPGPHVPNDDLDVSPTAGMEEMSLDEKSILSDLPANFNHHGATVNTFSEAKVDGLEQIDLHGDVEQVDARLGVSPAKKTASSRKGKRKSNIGPRRYNPDDLRIITLDSLGISHSPTCTRLKEYLIAEIKDKKGIDIPVPGSIGMTARHIPQQANYSDCGLFLLSYVEKFLDIGDPFIHTLLQGSDELMDLDWRKASEMRSTIRKDLFRLQEEQITENKQIQTAKAEAKKLKAKSAGAISESRIPPKVASPPKTIAAADSTEKLGKPIEPYNATRKVLPSDSHAPKIQSIDKAVIKQRKRDAALPQSVPPKVGVKCEEMIQPTRKSLAPSEGMLSKAGRLLGWPFQTNDTPEPPKMNPSNLSNSNSDVEVPHPSHPPSQSKNGVSPELDHSRPRDPSNQTTGSASHPENVYDPTQPRNHDHRREERYFSKQSHDKRNELGETATVPSQRTRKGGHGSRDTKHSVGRGCSTMKEIIHLDSDEDPDAVSLVPEQVERKQVSPQDFISEDEEMLLNNHQQEITASDTESRRTQELSRKYETDRSSEPRKRHGKKHFTALDAMDLVMLQPQ